MTIEINIIWVIAVVVLASIQAAIIVVQQHQAGKRKWQGNLSDIRIFQDGKMIEKYTGYVQDERSDVLYILDESERIVVVQAINAVVVIEEL